LLRIQPYIACLSLVVDVLAVAADMSAEMSCGPLPCWHVVLAVLAVQVTGVERDFIKIKSQGSDEVQDVPYGLCVWSTGDASRSVVMR
jgi:hypothetical protein